MTNKPMLSVELRVLGKAPLGERYYLCECPKCGWVGSSEECTQDEVLCLQKAGDDRYYGEADEIDAARLMELMQSGAFEKPAAQHQGEPVLIQAVAVTRDDEDEGLRLEWLLEGGIAEMEFAGMTLFAIPEANDLCDEDGSAEIYLSPQSAEQPEPVAVVMPERMYSSALPSWAEENKLVLGWNACLEEVARLNGVKP